MIVAERSNSNAWVFFPEDVGASLVDVFAALRLVRVRAAHEVAVGIILKLKKKRIAIKIRNNLILTWNK